MRTSPAPPRVVYMKLSGCFVNGEVAKLCIAHHIQAYKSVPLLLKARQIADHVRDY